MPRISSRSVCIPKVGEVEVPERYGLERGDIAVLSETFVEVKEIGDLSYVDSAVAGVSRRITYEIVSG